MGSFDKRSQKIVQSFAKIMNMAGVEFAILGNDERNSGDTARRMGMSSYSNNYVRKTLATSKNME